MNANKTIRLLKKLLLSAAALLAFSACENFGDPGAYFDSYGSVAKITSVTYSRQPVEKDGSYYIDSDDDFTITYMIDNPGNFAFANFSSSSSYTIELTKTYIKYSYPKNYLAQIDGDTAGLNSTVSLIALAPNGKMIPQEYYQGQKILCNSPPPKIENAVAQMYSDTSASINERLVIPVQIPTPASYYTYEHDGQTYKSYKYDYASLVVTDTRSGTVHEFPFQSYSSYIPNGTESNGWTVDLSVYSIGPTCPGGPTFTYDSSTGGSVCYIYTDVYDLTSIEPFPIKFFIRDKLGLEGEELEIPSRAVKLAAPTCSDSTGSLTNSLSAPYAEFTIYAPSNGPDATLHYTITDSSGNPVADTSGSASEHVGDATFNLYPKADGSAETYTISQAYATKTGCVDSDDAAATFGSAGTISVTGVQLESPVADIADGASIPQETKLTLESPQGGDIWWITSDAGASGDDPSPVEIIIDASGSYIVQAYAHKAYYQNSTIAKWTYNVFMSKVYIKSDGNDFGGTGTIGQPFQSFTRAKTAFATSGDPTDPANKIYVLDDMPSMNGLTSIDAGYYNVIGCNGGVAGAPVSLGVVGGGSIFSVNGGTLTLRSISITGQDHASSGAVDFIAGTFILKDKVTITGNSSAGAAKNINIASGQKITIDAGGLGGTKVGVTSADVPSGGTSVTITEGYKDACGTEPLGGHFVSDVTGYAFIFDAAGEAALATGGGSIDVGDIYSVAFAKTASAGVYTFTASATPTSGASPVDITDECTWSMKLYYLNTYTGMTSATNKMDLSAFGEGTYIMKIKATYGGKTYSGEVEVTVGGSLTTGMVLVPGATVSGAVSGSSVFITGRTVDIPSLYVCDHEVTQGEYETYCKYGGTAPSNSYGKGENFPAYYVNWYDAIVYCNLRTIAELGEADCVYSLNGNTHPKDWTGIVGDASTKYCGPSSTTDDWDYNGGTDVGIKCDTTKKGYRLPTEAEWEYIARNKNADNYTYSGSDNIAEVAWYTTNAGSKTHEVKTDKVAGIDSANGLGIYDMSGNVWEWCWDWHDDITTGSPASGASSGSLRVRRGGSRSDDASSCAVAYRGTNYPHYRYYYYGFRVVRNAP